MTRRLIFDVLIYAVSSLFVLSIIIQFKNTINYPGTIPKKLSRKIRNSVDENTFSIQSISKEPHPTVVVYKPVEVPVEVLNNAMQPDPNPVINFASPSKSLLPSRVPLTVEDNSKNMTLFYKSIKTKALCPEVVRVGGDIGANVCNPSRVGKNCTLLSFNSYNNTNFTTRFEEYFEKINSECNFIGEEHNGMEHILFNVTTVEGILQESGVTEVEFLKVDVEDEEIIGEIASIVRKYPVCQVLASVDTEIQEIHLKLIEILAKSSFWLFSMSPHLKCEECCDYSFINEKCMERFGVSNKNSE